VGDELDAADPEFDVLMKGETPTIEKLQAERRCEELGFLWWCRLAGAAGPLRERDDALRYRLVRGR
jgi:hypothetical protein